MFSIVATKKIDRVGRSESTTMSAGQDREVILFNLTQIHTHINTKMKDICTINVIFFNLTQTHTHIITKVLLNVRPLLFYWYKGVIWHKYTHIAILNMYLLWYSNLVLYKTNNTRYVEDRPVDKRRYISIFDKDIEENDLRVLYEGKGMAFPIMSAICLCGVPSQCKYLYL